MSPQDALKILDNATAQLQADRKSHILISQALETLQKVVEPTTSDVVSDENK